MNIVWTVFLVYKSGAFLCVCGNWRRRRPWQRDRFENARKTLGEYTGSLRCSDSLGKHSLVANQSVHDSCLFANIVFSPRRARLCQTDNAKRIPIWQSSADVADTLAVIINMRLKRNAMTASLLFTKCEKLLYVLFRLKNRRIGGHFVLGSPARFETETRMLVSKMDKFFIILDHWFCFEYTVHT